ncbi:peptidase S10, serine carboxypeptidase [Flagelloscypha sp. PMI_526]|nr:peptidase S10, serine carboxypeptidase [Flagelloscypha sp. PMI_526]
MALFCAMWSWFAIRCSVLVMVLYLAQPALSQQSTFAVPSPHIQKAPILRVVNQTFHDSEPCFPGSLEYSGYLDTSDGKHLFFRFFESRQAPNEAPFLLWMNGGPGPSSANGYLLEAGPCTIVSGTKTVYNPFSWTEVANVMFLDQPVGTGYSYSDPGVPPVVTSEEAAEDIYVLLQTFFERFPKYSPLQFHIMGESYGGHYAPHLASIIQLRRKEHDFNLHSVILINALVNPLIQTEYDVNLVCDLAHGILDPLGPECLSLKKSAEAGKLIFLACNEDPLQCPKAAEYLFFDLLEKLFLLSHNPYDFTAPCNRSPEQDGPTCYRQSMWAANYLNQSQIKGRLGVNLDFNFQLESDEVMTNFISSGDAGTTTATMLEAVIESGVRVLVMTGDRDTLCDYTGAQAWMEALSNPFQQQFRQTSLRPWDLFTRWIKNIPI